MVAMALSWSALPKLRGLSLAYADVRAEGTEMLMRSLIRNMTVSDLDLSGNQLSGASVRAITFTLAHNRVLRKLVLADCGVHEPSACQLVAGMLSNPNLKLTDVVGFNLGPPLVTLGHPQNLAQTPNRDIVGKLCALAKAQQAQVQSQQRGSGTRSQKRQRSTEASAFMSAGLAQQGLFVHLPRVPYDPVELGELHKIFCINDGAEYLRVGPAGASVQALAAKISGASGGATSGPPAPAPAPAQASSAAPAGPPPPLPEDHQPPMGLPRGGGGSMGSLGGFDLAGLGDLETDLDSCIVLPPGILASAADDFSDLSSRDFADISSAAAFAADALDNRAANALWGGPNGLDALLGDDDAGPGDVDLALGDGGGAGTKRAHALVDDDAAPPPALPSAAGPGVDVASASPGGGPAKHRRIIERFPSMSRQVDDLITAPRNYPTVLTMLRQLSYWTMYMGEGGWVTRRVLVVDDSASVRSFLKKVFEHKGYVTVLLAAAAAAAMLLVLVRRPLSCSSY